MFGDGTPIDQMTQLTTSSLGGVSGGTAFMDQAFTLSFPVGGSAFGLVDGARVLGPALIDNCFGGSLVCSVASVPEPQSWLLMLLALPMLLARLRSSAREGLISGRPAPTE
jgi:hypothetical protein